MALLEKINEKYGTTMLIVTHNNSIKNMVHKVIRIKDGMISKEYENEVRMFRNRENINLVKLEEGRATENESEVIYSITTKEDVKKAANVFISSMQSMMITLLVIAIIIFIVIMYLMMKVMIDRSAFHISMVKVFGYRTKEIKKLYLDGNFITVVVGANCWNPAHQNNYG